MVYNIGRYTVLCYAFGYLVNILRGFDEAGAENKAESNSKTKHRKANILAPPPRRAAHLPRVRLGGSGRGVVGVRRRPNKKRRRPRWVDSVGNSRRDGRCGFWDGRPEVCRHCINKRIIARGREWNVYNGYCPAPPPPPPRGTSRL